MPVTTEILKQIGFVGTRDSEEPQTADLRKAFLLQNVYPPDPKNAGAIVGRPGIKLTQNTQLGIVGNRVGQRSYQFTRYNSGTGTYEERTLTFIGGKMYEYDWPTAVWTEKVLSGAGVALTAGKRVFCTTFANKLIVNPNDGTTKPWMWDGTTFTTLTSAPTMYGRLEVYYAKLFGIKWAERTTFSWSEENDPETGYEVSGFNNAWTLGTTAREDLTAILATNEALYYWRAGSVGAILGAVNTDFTTTGVRDMIAEGIGTRSPEAIVLKDDRIYFLDQFRRPQMIRSGVKGTIPIWDDARVKATSDVNPVILDRCQAVAHPEDDLILFGVGNSGALDPNQLLVYRDFEDQPPQYVGVWNGFPFQTLDVVKGFHSQLDPYRPATIMHTGAGDGRVYFHGLINLGTQTWKDELQAGDAAITHIVEGGPLGWDTRWDKYFDLVDISFHAVQNMTGMTLSYRTPEGVSANISLPTVTAVAGDRERHVQLGLGAHGRWCRLKLTHNTLNERFGLNGWSVETFLESTQALVP